MTSKNRGRFAFFIKAKNILLNICHNIYIFNYSKLFYQVIQAAIMLGVVMALTLVYNANNLFDLYKAIIFFAILALITIFISKQNDINDNV